MHLLVLIVEVWTKKIKSLTALSDVVQIQTRICSKLFIKVHPEDVSEFSTILIEKLAESCLANRLTKVFIGIIYLLK